MTAKEVLESILFTWSPPFDDKEFKEHLIRYSELLCREQKRIDSIAVDNESGYDGDTVNLQAALKAIDNALMPEL